MHQDLQRLRVLFLILLNLLLLNEVEVIATIRHQQQIHLIRHMVLPPYFINIY